uniref:ATP-dependent DNA helicase n=1 Tax=Amphimedon queenslandica TaxID=400682 RepID=A0A1X7VQH0_AMPQE
MSRPTTPQFNAITILDFTCHYTMPKELGDEPKKRSKEVIVTPRPYCSPNSSGLNYEQYCRHSLMKCKPFRDINELKCTYDTFTEAYAEFLQSGNVPRSLEQDIFRLQQHQSSAAVEDEGTSQDEQQQNQKIRAQEECMLISPRTSELEPVNTTEEEHAWAEAARSYSDIDNAPNFIAQGRQNTTPTPFTTSATPDNLQGRQLDVYTTVKQHFESNCQEPLHIIINGTAGTGKSNLINCLWLLLGGSVRVAAPTGVASFIIEGRTLHSLLHLPVRGDFKEMEGSNLQKMQDEMSSTKYLIIDEMSMMGRKTFGY